jgi:hypothetical protein
VWSQRGSCSSTRYKARARAILEAAATEFAKNWIEAAVKGAERGRHEPAMDALLHLKVIEPVAKDMNTGIQVIIGVPLPGMPGSEAIGTRQKIMMNLPGNDLGLADLE